MRKQKVALEHSITSAQGRGKPPVQSNAAPCKKIDPLLFSLKDLLPAGSSLRVERTQ